MTNRRSNKTLNSKELAKEGSATIADFGKDLTDPKLIGPGTWHIIHTEGFRAQSHDQIINFISLMTRICDEFPCKACSGHCKEYIKTFPMIDNANVTVDGKPLGMFLWTWRFHNAVNRRTGKKAMSWETAYGLYSKTVPLVCGEACTNAHEEGHEVRIKPVTFPPTKFSVVKVY